MSHLRVIPAIACASVLALTACAAPKTSKPSYSKDEVRAEASEQSKASGLIPEGFDENKTYSKPELEALFARLGAVAKRVEPAAGALCTDLTGGRNRCVYQVKFAPNQKGINAHADGNNVVVYPGVVDFARNDNQLAFVIAHEFAHNIMNHVASQQQNAVGGSLLGAILDIAASSQGINTQGQLGKLGGSMAAMQYSQAFEEEADYVGLYILARAGFAIEDAPYFWRAMSQADPKGIYGGSSHPSNPSRFIAMNKTIAEIRAKQKAGEPLVPNFQKGKSLSSISKGDINNG